MAQILDTGGKRRPLYALEVRTAWEVLAIQDTGDERMPLSALDVAKHTVK